LCESELACAILKVGLLISTNPVLFCCCCTHIHSLWQSLLLYLYSGRSHFPLVSLSVVRMSNYPLYGYSSAPWIPGVSPPLITSEASHTSFLQDFHAVDDRVRGGSSVSYLSLPKEDEAQWGHSIRFHGHLGQCSFPPSYVRD